MLTCLRLVWRRRWVAICVFLWSSPQENIKDCPYMNCNIMARIQPGSDSPAGCRHILTRGANLACSPLTGMFMGMVWPCYHQNSRRLCIMYIYTCLSYLPPPLTGASYSGVMYVRWCLDVTDFFCILLLLTFCLLFIISHTLIAPWRLQSTGAACLRVHPQQTWGQNWAGKVPDAGWSMHSEKV